MYIFIAKSDDDVEYCLGNESSELIEADDLQEAVSKYRYIIENREEVEKYGESPSNPYNSEWDSSIHEVVVYKVEKEIKMNVAEWEKEVQDEIEAITMAHVEEQEKEEYERLKKKFK